MSAKDMQLPDFLARGLARLAVLQRLREHLEKGERQAAIRSIDRLIEAEAALLRAKYSRAFQKR